MKKISALLIISIIFSFVSCTGLIDESTLKKVRKEPKIQEIAGKWKADKFSYNIYIDIIKNSKEIITDSINLILNDDYSFILENGPNIEKGILTQKTYKGKWNLEKDNGNAKMIKIKFKLNNQGKKPNYLKFGLSVYEQTPTQKIVLLGYYQDDPDTGGRILFKK